MSKMVFRGGPNDGRTESPETGWPAPNVCMSRDWPGRYVRGETVFDRDSGETTHFYDYEAPATPGATDE